MMGRPQLGRSGSRDRDLGGRAARRSADSTADMERRSAQERMFALDLEKVLSGEDKHGHQKLRCTRLSTL